MVETIVQDLLNAAKHLSEKCTRQIPTLLKHKDVAHVTNPLDYAWERHEQFIRKWGGCGAKTLLLGMNPGPYGMAQTGVPFGATKMATDVLGIEAESTDSGAAVARSDNGIFCTVFCADRDALLCAVVGTFGVTNPRHVRRARR